MNTKRIICVILVALMMSLFSVNIFAAESVTASTATSVTKGETITVTVSISDTSGIARGVVYVYYSADQLTYVSSQYDEYFVSSVSSHGYYASINISNRVGSTISDTLATLTFEVVADAGTDCQINVSAIGCVDIYGNSVTVNSSTTAFTVVEVDDDSEVDVDNADDDDEITLDEETESAVTEATTTAATTT
ncbi:MAG: hypothetical protein LUF29_01785 [Oscillospiraceae bacterium]|nr:hypothetical protein [Oscillospiraceae bacterium]